MLADIVMPPDHEPGVFAASRRGGSGRGRLRLARLGATATDAFLPPGRAARSSRDNKGVRHRPSLRYGLASQVRRRPPRPVDPHRGRDGRGFEIQRNDDNGQHWRLFATNDERTAKRVSDALGVATELRAMRNYAGHRLSPWLGHLMVSRQETARQLLTPGEVMQLPADEEIVMVSGAPPIRARKVRYYQDARLRRRVLTPPQPASLKRPAPGPDDWTGLTVPAAPSPAPSAAGYRHDDDDDEGGGPRREPGLPEHEDITAPPTVQDEFAFDDADLDAGQIARRLALQRRMGAVARQASLDPDDGVEL